MLKADGSILTEGELTPGVDYISFGATICDDLVCVRDAKAPPASDPSAPAAGICSHACSQTSTSCQSATEVRLTCRELLLNEVALGQACAVPARCQDVGGSLSPFYCAAVR